MWKIDKCSLLNIFRNEIICIYTLAAEYNLIKQNESVPIQ